MNENESHDREIFVGNSVRMEKPCVDKGRLWFADNVFSVQGGKTDGRLLLQWRTPLSVPGECACSRRISLSSSSSS